ncbi:MAG: peptidylprolyl isomerase [Burkholderiaceae bacterium]|jgi:peptidyl-prolyl cis-trans isomerase SurA|nr:peptidylprolyl isomerase [Burkholderiaceae bacterium]
MTKTKPLRCALILAPVLSALIAWPASAQSGRAQTSPAKSAAAKRASVKPKPATAKRAPLKKPAAAKRAPAPPKPATSAAAPVVAPVAAPASPSAAPTPQPAAAPSPADANARQADFIVAIVNTEPITNNEVRTRTLRAQRQLAERAMTAPPTEQLRKEMLERLIGERAQLQYAREQGLTVSDAALSQAEMAIAQQNQLTSVEELHRRVEREGLTVKDFRDDVRNQVLLARLRQNEIEPRIQVTESEIDAFLREQTGAQIGGIDLNLAMILIAVPEQASAEETERLRARADDIAKRARDGENFAQLAREFSDANNRGGDGGVLGLRPSDRYPQLFVRSTQSARVSDIVGPVKSDAGFHILKVLERKQNNDLPEVKIAQTHVHHILLRVTPAQNEAVAREQLADLKRRIESGQASFEQLAQQYSQDDSARDGGDLGWTTPGQFAPEFEQAMNSLTAGQLSNPVISRFGVHLIRVDERREQVLTAAEQRQMARNVLREKKAQEAFDTWVKEVRGRAYVEYRDPPR